jgi:protein TonB
MIQPTEIGMATIKDLEARYGLPKSVEVFKENTDESVRGNSDGGVVIEPSKSKNENSYIILEFTEQVRQALSATEQGGSVYTVVEQMPEYVGGLGALNAYIMENLKYPEAAREAGLQGTFYTQFIVNADGSVSDVQVLKSTFKDDGAHAVEIPTAVVQKCSDEAIRVVQSMPKWVPGKQDGKNVRVKYVVPIKFQFS